MGRPMNTFFENVSLPSHQPTNKATGGFTYAYVEASVGDARSTRTRYAENAISEPNTTR
jgi:hypothetical protein